MGKAGKSRRADRRKQKRREAREARKRLYKSYAESGANSKSKRFIKSRVRRCKTVDHPCGPCGNPACMKCHFPTAVPKVGHRAWLYKQGRLVVPEIR